MDRKVDRTKVREKLLSMNMKEVEHLYYEAIVADDFTISERFPELLDMSTEGRDSFKLGIIATIELIGGERGVLGD